ncbi:1-acylglycerol-3-phosphate O-acyltransferase [Synchytrium microbalum]|uniref:1-acyl-sn-glycerol-3-phosphate acyltransferase n=1 Tax=Synchytrium microbalum TaxID=1806994 RepID=A0A507C425_9FUNG|nr:1-acylglycerol-3-phosphate O-acyltransferase [Synchytrium microbalum]TPX34138.1 1-acylglycerol-3-phosphate O-acyltransferase [Synchytrium microbalum]
MGAPPSPSNSSKSLDRLKSLAILPLLILVIRRFDVGKLVLGILALGLATIGSTGCGILMAPYIFATGNKRQFTAWTCKIFTWFAPLCGVKVTVENKHILDNATLPCVIMLNHQSSLDLLTLSHVMREGSTVLGKKDLFYVPVLGPWMWLSDQVFIDRKNHDSAMVTMNKVADVLIKKKQCLYIFPEGTRSSQEANELLPFKKGGFHVALAGQMPIIPIVISTYGDIYSLRKKVWKGGDIRIRVLDPIETKGYTSKDLNELMDKTRNVMLSTLHEISPPPLPDAKKLPTPRKRRADDDDADTHHVTTSKAVEPDADTAAVSMSLRGKNDSLPKL